MTIIYASEDSNGTLTGIFARPQTFFQTVEIDDADPKVAAFIAAQTPPPSCQLWQLQAVLTADQWNAALAFIAASGNPALTAFAAHGTNVIPANSKTLAAIAQAAGINPATLPTIVAEAALISIP